MLARSEKLQRATFLARGDFDTTSHLLSAAQGAHQALPAATPGPGACLPQRSPAPPVLRRPRPLTTAVTSLTRPGASAERFRSAGGALPSGVAARSRDGQRPEVAWERAGWSGAGGRCSVLTCGHCTGHSRLRSSHQPLVMQPHRGTPRVPQ